jgi:hypothetical protein
MLTTFTPAPCVREKNQQETYHSEPGMEKLRALFPFDHKGINIAAIKIPAK